MATQYSVNLGLDVFPTTTDPDNAFDINRLYNACRSLAIGLDSASGAIGRDPSEWAQTGTNALRLQNMTRVYVMFSESVIAGNIINLYNNAGVLNARKAGGAALAGGLARGFVIASVTSGSYGEVFLGGANAFISGLTPGTPYYLSTGTAGLLTPTAPGGGLTQDVGFALSSSVLWFNPLPYAR